jgi:hypothetical protein
VISWFLKVLLFQTGQRMCRYAAVSSILYEKRFGPYYAEPVVAGLDADGKPFITGMDLIGEENIANAAPPSPSSSPPRRRGVCASVPVHACVF